jgi:hypothetical protein
MQVVRVYIYIYPCAILLLMCSYTQLITEHYFIERDSVIRQLGSVISDQFGQ